MDELKPYYAVTLPNLIVTFTSGTIEYSEFNNPYSWDIDCLNDWRCVVDILRARNNQRLDK